MKVFCFLKGSEGNGGEASFAEAAVCRTVYYLCTYGLFCFRLFFFHYPVLSALRTILGLEGKCLSILLVITLMDVWFCPQLKY